MLPLVSTRPISELFGWLAPFAAHARSADRIAEYRDHGQADINYETRVVFEILMAQRDEIERLTARVAEMEKLLTPEDEPVLLEQSGRR
jgi:hypothetical protein